MYCVVLPANRPDKFTMYSDFISFDVTDWHQMYQATLYYFDKFIQ